ncbi:MAG: FAD/NAD(P)-binding protein [Hyphomonadaceae bacterium]
MSRRRIVVIGAGASGVITAAQLMARKPGPHVLLVDGARFGPGLAYATADKTHLLNVRAANMSAYAGKPDDFARWARAKGVSPESFAPRAVYGAYLKNVLARAERARIFDRLKRIRGAAVSCRVAPGAWHVGLASGALLEADAVVLALGAAPPSPIRVFEEAGVPVLDPWDAPRLRRIRRGDVLLMGAGLTMIDAALSLAARSRTGTIYAISRRGQIPRAHLDLPAPPTQQELRIPAQLSDAVRAFRSSVAAMAARGEPWQLAIDRLRADTPALWQALPLEAKRRFVRHLRVWWDVHRHRAAPESAARANEMLASGKLRVLAGDVVSAARGKRGFEIYHRQRGSFVRHRLDVSAVINCTGAEPNITRSADPLIRQLLDEGVGRAHPSGFGLDLDSEARLVAASGLTQPNLFAIGALTQGAFWESIAIPEIRARAAAIAQRF